MSIDLLHRCMMASVLAVVLTPAPAPAKENPAKQLESRLPKICAELQKQGWGVPADQLKMNPDTKAEMRMGKQLYMCSLGRQLPGTGPGHAPDLSALLTGSSGDPTLILSASVWCAADREPALEALAKEVERVLTGSKISAPAAVLEAIRAARKHDATVDGMRYRVEPIEVDAGACDRVGPGQLGAVLMKIDVAVEPGS
jgi:hypothetical protein